MELKTHDEYNQKSLTENRRNVMDDHTHKMSEKDFKALINFVGREDIKYSQDVLVIEKSDNFEEAEVVVLFKDEVFIRCRKKEETIIHNENLNIDSDFRFEWDSAISMRREDISCISVLRPPICDCPACSKKREKGETPEQAKYYLLEIMTSAKDYSIRIPKEDKQGAFALQNYIREWRFETGEFAKSSKKKSNSKTKNNGR